MNLLNQRCPIASLAYLLLFLLVIAGSDRHARGQTEYRILPRDFNADAKQQMMRAYLRDQVHEALDLRLRELEEAMSSGEKFAAYQQRRREFLRFALGEMPERTPLNSQLRGTIQGDRFTIEKVLFESQPGFHVTANLYRPVGPGPFPAILHPIGHAEDGKAYGDYQRVNRLLVQHGFVVLCFDPIGQGERKQFFTADGMPAQRASAEHQQLGVAPILLGRSLASYMVWDAVRAMDYLAGRPDVDPARIGCTGNSGGGNLTSYLMAYDDRIAAAALGCFMTTHRRKNETPGPGDAEQNLFFQIGKGFDHADFVLARAPKPTLILAATHDFIPIAGTWEAYRQAKRVYTQLGFPERVELIEANAGHGYSRRLREGAVRFFARHLQARKLEVFEEESVPTLSEKDLQVTPAGQVRRLADARSILDLFAEYERQLAARRPQLTREIVRKVTGIRPLDQVPHPRVESAKATGHGEDSESAIPIGSDSNTPVELVFHPEPGIVLPALHWPRGNREPVLIAPADGINSAVAAATRLHVEGHPVLVVELRDTGETATRNWRFVGADYYIAHMLGRCWLAMRAEDLLVSARWLIGQEGASSVRLIADGEIGPAARHAAVLEPQLFAAVVLSESLPSWRALMTTPDAHSHLHNAVQGALQYYDLPDLQRMQSELDKE